MSENLYPHKSGLGLMEPVALINHNVCIFYSGAKKWRKVIYSEPIPPFQCLNIGAVAAQSQSGLTQAVNLALFDDEFAQYRWYPIDNAQVRLWLPQADGRYVLRNMQVPVDMTIVDRDPCLHLTEFFVWEDNDPWFQAINGTDYPLTQCRIMAQGYRYITTELKAPTINKIEAGQEACTYIVATGASGITR